MGHVEARGYSSFRDGYGQSFGTYYDNGRSYIETHRYRDGRKSFTFGLRGRHSVNVVIESRRPPGWQPDDYVPYHLRRDWRQGPIHRRCDDPPATFRADPPSSSPPRPIFDENNQLLNAEELPEPPHAVVIH